MSDSWTRVQDVARFLAEKGQRRVREHAMTRPILNYRYCAHCGLLGLRNETTQRALREKCVTYE